jgi:WD40 repeat protein
LFRTTLLRTALCVAGTPDTIIVGCEDGNVYGHNLLSGDPLWQVTDAHHGGVRCVTVAENKRFFVTGGTTGEVRIWDMGTRALIAQLDGHTQPVRALRLFEDNAHLVSCGSDRSFITWDLKENRKVSQHAQRMGGMHSVGITPDKTIVTVGQEKRISFWDLRETKAQHVISPVKGGEQLCVVVSPCGRYLGCGGTDREVTVWDIKSKECIRRGSAHAGDIVSLCFEENSNRIITAGRDGNILIWRM